MRYQELTFGGKTITNQTKINQVLSENNFFWLIDSEVEEAKIEIKNGTLIWHEGDFFGGNWHYGIFKSGNFWGNWENGIFEGGNFMGKWKSGIKSN